MNISLTFSNVHATIPQKTRGRIPSVTVPRKAAPWLSKEDQEQVLEFIPSRHQGIIRFIMAYGCRPSEACNLRKGDVDKVQGTIIFRNRKNAEDNILPILPEIEAILNAPRKVEHMIYAFCNSWGSQIRPQYLSAVWFRANGQASEKYGLKRVPLKNGTRHSLASQLRNRGVGLSDIARILGNTEAIVEKSYGRVSVGRVAEVMGIRKGKEE